MTIINSAAEPAFLRLGRRQLEKTPALKAAPLPAGSGGRKPESFSAVLDAASGSPPSPKAEETRRMRKPVIDKKDKLYEQCQALETFLIKNLLSSMRNTVQKSGLINEGFAGKMYEDMLYDEYAGTYAKSAGFGLAELAYLELSGQRGTPPPSS
ncbi:MAG: rod-binding protein [Spirochaetaceae bacterium]|jgi:flagellar protein FlgJ|nr:rod-binding protein [Spirochaetaceae bacterium]